jgi:hypothetical protein
LNRASEAKLAPGMTSGHTTPVAGLHETKMIGKELQEIESLICGDLSCLPGGGLHRPCSEYSLTRSTRPLRAAVAKSPLVVQTTKSGLREVIKLGAIRITNTGGIAARGKQSTEL